MSGGSMLAMKRSVIGGTDLVRCLLQKPGSEERTG